MKKTEEELKELKAMDDYTDQGNEDFLGKGRSEISFDEVTLQPDTATPLEVETIYLGFCKRHPPEVALGLTQAYWSGINNRHTYE